MERAEAESAVVFHFFQELVMCVQCFEVARVDGGDDGVAALVDAVVEVAVELRNNRSGSERKE